MPDVPSSVATRRFIRYRYAFSVLAALLSLLAATQFDAASRSPPSRSRPVSDSAFWRMIVDFSDRGLFRSDNFVSNETTYKGGDSRAEERTSPDGVYLGVGLIKFSRISPRSGRAWRSSSTSAPEPDPAPPLQGPSSNGRPIAGFSYRCSHARDAALEESSTPKACSMRTAPAGDEMLFQKNLAE